ncbi:MAG: sortase [bacterium]|nr:sortase [bacterium]
MLNQTWKQAVTGQCLRGNFPQVRQRFFDERLFNGELATPPVNWKKFVINTSLNCSLAVGALMLVAYFVPQWTFNLFPVLTENFIQAEELKTPETTDAATEQLILSSLPERDEISATATAKIKPKYNLNLPAGQWLQIESVGIDAQILSNGDINDKKAVNKILDQGIYAYPEFASYGSQNKPVILAGHHYNMWTSVSKDTQSFQKLDQVQVGDVVVITDNQKQWTYQIYKVEQAAALTEENADLIMYTCVFWWDSELRLFTYGHLINP